MARADRSQCRPPIAAAEIVGHEQQRHLHSIGASGQWHSGARSSGYRFDALPQLAAEAEGSPDAEQRQRREDGCSAC